MNIPRPKVHLPRPVLNIPRPKVHRLPRPAIRLPRPAIRLPRALPARPAAIGLALLVAAGCAAVALRSGGGSGQATEATSSKLAVRLPDGWKPAPANAGGLELTAPVAAGAAGAGRPELLAGFAADRGQVRRLIEAADASGGDRATVRLGALQARTWGRARVDGTPARVYVGYTSSGPLVAICHSAPGSPAARSCQNVVQTLTLSGPRPISPASIEQFRSRFGSTITTLRKTWIERRAALAAAPIASDQAREASALERTFTEASSQIADIRIPSGVADTTSVVSALGQAADGYGTLADAIRRADHSGYDGARADILASEARLEKAVAQAAIP